MRDRENIEASGHIDDLLDEPGEIASRHGRRLNVLYPIGSQWVCPHCSASQHLAVTRRARTHGPGW